jgi:metal-dependent amidase/aminoacylase/carboxypeptidase family protein
MATRYPSKSRIGNREFRTAALIVKHLESLGIDVQKGRCDRCCWDSQGDKPGPVVALRADMDALPLKRRMICHMRRK